MSNTSDDEHQGLTSYYNGIPVQQLPPGPEPKRLSADVPRQCVAGNPGDFTVSPNAYEELGRKVSVGAYHIRQKYS